jgi:hypothetical protein
MMFLVAFIGFVSACAAAWGIVLNQRIYLDVKETLPPEFDDEEFRYATYPQFALSPSTPLRLQADYVRAGISLCSACLGFSVCAFLLGSTTAALIFLVFFLGLAAASIRHMKIYRENRVRRMTRSEGEG